MDGTDSRERVICAVKCPSCGCETSQRLVFSKYSHHDVLTCETEQAGCGKLFAARYCFNAPTEITTYFLIEHLSKEVK